MAFDPEYYRQLEVGIEAIVADMASIISEKDISEVRSFVDVGEYGIALEWLCGAITETPYSVPLLTFEKISSLALRMGIKEHFWVPVKEHVGEQ